MLERGTRAIDKDERSSIDLWRWSMILPLDLSCTARAPHTAGKSRPEALSLPFIFP